MCEGIGGGRNIWNHILDIATSSAGLSVENLQLVPLAALVLEEVEDFPLPLARPLQDLGPSGAAGEHHSMSFGILALVVSVYVRTLASEETEMIDSQTSAFECPLTSSDVSRSLLYDFFELS